MGLIIIFRIILVLIVLFVLIYFLLPDIFKKSPEKKKELNSLEEIEKQSLEILNEKRVIRGVTDQTQKTINQIHKNLEN